MSEPGIRTDKRFQLTVMGAIGLLATVMIAVVLLFLETSTISMAATLVLALMLLVITALLIEL